tara:strand:+ start:214 stop:522 length:309 start_codon:yes stop_codon:yes gene_type:complete
MRHLTVKGTIITASPESDFIEIYEEVLLQIPSSSHKFAVTLGVSHEQWAVKPHKTIRYSKSEYEHFFNFDYNCEDFNVNRIVLLGKANIQLDNEILAEPLIN